MVNFVIKFRDSFTTFEQFWSMLKDKVYANNWSAKNRDQLIRKIRKCSKEFDMAPILKMFDHLKGKIKKSYQEIIEFLFFLTNLSHM